MKINRAIEIAMEAINRNPFIKYSAEEIVEASELLESLKTVENDGVFEGRDEMGEL